MSGSREMGRSKHRHKKPDSKGRPKYHPDGEDDVVSGALHELGKKIHIKGSGRRNG